MSTKIDLPSISNNKATTNAEINGFDDSTQNTKKNKWIVDMMILDFVIIGGKLQKKTTISCQVSLGDLIFSSNNIQTTEDLVWNEDASFLTQDLQLSVSVFDSSTSNLILLGKYAKDLSTSTTNEITELNCDISSQDEVIGRVHLFYEITKSKEKKGFLSHYGTCSSILPLRLDVVLMSTSYVQASGIKLATWSEWDHCAIVTRNKKGKLRLLEAAPGGVDIFRLDGRLEFYYHDLSSKFLVRRLELDKPQSLVQSFREFAKQVEGRPYKQLSNFMELLRALNSSNTAENLESIFCSELCAAAFKHCGMLNPSILSNNILPRDLLDDAKFKLVRGKLGRSKLYLQRQILVNAQNAGTTQLP